MFAPGQGSCIELVQNCTRYLSKIGSMGVTAAHVVEACLPKAFGTDSVTSVNCCFQKRFLLPVSLRNLHISTGPVIKYRDVYQSGHKRNFTRVWFWIGHSHSRYFGFLYTVLVPTSQTFYLQRRNLSTSCVDTTSKNKGFIKVLLPFLI